MLYVYNNGLMVKLKLNRPSLSKPTEQLRQVTTACSLTCYLK